MAVSTAASLTQSQFLQRCACRLPISCTTLSEKFTTFMSGRSFALTLPTTFSRAFSSVSTCSSSSSAFPSSLVSRSSYLHSSPRPTSFLLSRSLFIQTQSTPNPNSLKFLPGKPVLTFPSNPSSSSAPPSDSLSTVEFTSPTESKSSPLATALFAIDGVSSVLFSSEFVTVSVVEGSDWAYVKPHVYAAIMDFYSSGVPILKSDFTEKSANDTQINPEDDDTVALIKELIETRIRPAVQEDGGDIVYKGFDRSSGIVSVLLAGSCRGCSSSSITLKNGIENMLQHYVPEVKAVKEWKDEELESVSEDQLKKLEENLAKIKEKK